MAIQTVEFDLSMIDPDTGLNRTARAYTVAGIDNSDGTPRELSIGQLVMALCLERASALEAQIIALMDQMNDTSAQLAAMTTIEEDVLAGTVNMNQKTLTYNGSTYTYKAFLTDETIGIKMANVPNSANADSKAFITDLEAQMDSKNSFSQQKMIELQSDTSKRDQAYDMISNILKSLNQVLVGNANNI